MQVIKFKGNRGLPDFLKDSIRSLIKTVYTEDIDVTVEKHKENKTDPQRKYFWALIKELRLAIKNRQTEQDIYLHILRVYGVSDWVMLPEDQIIVAKDYYRIVEDKGPATLRDSVGRELPVRQLKCWKGLSDYSKEEACMLIDGAISECESCGIQTDSPEDLKRMKEQWGVDIGQEA